MLDFLNEKKELVEEIVGAVRYVVFDECNPFTEFAYHFCNRALTQFVATAARRGKEEVNDKRFTCLACGKRRVYLFAAAADQLSCNGESDYRRNGISFDIEKFFELFRKAEGQ